MNPIYNCTEPNIGLRLSEERNTFKGFFLDTGLLITLAFSLNDDQIKEVYQKIITNKLEFNKGMLMENIVAQMLIINHNNVYFFF